MSPVACLIATRYVFKHLWAWLVGFRQLACFQDRWRYTLVQCSWMKADQHESLHCTASKIDLLSSNISKLANILVSEFIKTLHQIIIEACLSPAGSTEGKHGKICFNSWKQILFNQVSTIFLLHAVIPAPSGALAPTVTEINHP